VTFKDEETSDKAASYYYKYLKADNINRLINAIETEIQDGVPGPIEVRIMAHILREFYNSKHKLDDEDIDCDHEETIAEIKFDNSNTVWRSDIVAKV
jgi:hypothetical protein